jgi:hypothetical protein
LNINHFVVLPVDKLIAGEFEDLPPLTVCAPDLEVLVSTFVLNIPRLVVQSGLDSQ